MTTPKEVKVAIIQHPPTYMNLASSIEKAKAFIKEAAGHGAGLIVFPETWLPGYPVWLDYAPNAGIWDHPPAKALFRLLAENSPQLDAPEIKALIELAGQLNVHVVMGMHERLGGTLYNTMLFISNDGNTVLPHRKLMPTYTERLVWGRGDGSTLPVLDTDFGKLSGLICWEHWMPLARAAMHAKHETVHIAQWPMVKGLHQIASRHYAFEGQCFVVAAGCMLSKQEALDGITSHAGGDEAATLVEEIPVEDNELLLRGGSAVIAPDVSYLSEPMYDQAGIIYADIDPAIIPEGHLFLDTNGHYSRPDVFRLEVDDRPQNGVEFLSGK